MPGTQRVGQLNPKGDRLTNAKRLTAPRFIEGLGRHKFEHQEELVRALSHLEHPGHVGMRHGRRRPGLLDQMRANDRFTPEAFVYVPYQDGSPQHRVASSKGWS